MRRFSCDEARTQLSDALAGEIGRPEANVLEAHLLECDPCRSLSELFLWQDRVLTELSAQARLDTLLARVREGLQHLDQVSFLEESERSSRRRPWGWMAAAAAFAVALAGVLILRPLPPVEQITQLPAPSRALPAPAPEPSASPVPATNPEESAPVPLVELPAPQPVPVAEGSPPQAPLPAPKRPDPVVPPKGDPAPPAPPAAPQVTSNPGREVVQAPQKPRTLDDGLRGAMAFLRGRAATFARDSKSDELLLWTYLQAGVPESDPEFQALLKPLGDKKLEKTYNVALMVMVLEELDRVKYQKRIAQGAQYLIDNQCANGQWGYGDPSIFAEELILPPPPAKSKGLRKIPILRKREGAPSGDNSNTMYALLGLRACHDAGILLPPASIELAARWWRDTQTRSSPVKPPAIAAEGWCYSRHDHKPYGSMTAGGVGSLVICDYIQARDWKKDREVACGVEWLAKNFSVTYNPGPFEHAGFEENSQHQYFYYMYALERAAILYGTEQIGGQYWFAKGLTALLDTQRADGSWKSPSGGSELTDTCFAVLFLRKATRALPDVITPSTLKK